MDIINQLKMDFVRIVFVFVLFEMSNSSRILLIPFHDGSLVSHIASLGRQLAENGNEVHVLLMENPKNEKKFKEMEVKTLIYKTKRLSGQANQMWIEQVINDFVTSSMEGPFEVLRAGVKLTNEMVEEGRNLLNNEQIMDKISNMKFDMVVIDGLAFCLYQYLIPYKYDIPFVTFMTQWDPFTTGVPHMTSYVPSPLMPFSDDV